MGSSVRYEPAMRAWLMGGILAAGLIGGAWHHVECTPSFSGQYVYTAAIGPRHARVFLIPGMDGTAANFMRGYGSAAWVHGLAAMGADVVLLNTPIPKACWFSDGGVRYRDGFLKEFDAIAADAKAKHGPAGQAVVAGYSYGGLHAMVAYAARPSSFVGWEAAMPVVKLGALGELAAVGDAPSFNALSIQKQLFGTQGFLSWGTIDWRVDNRWIESLAIAVRSPGIVTKAYPGVGHERTAQAIADLLADARRQLQERPGMVGTQRDALYKAGERNREKP